MIYNDMSYIRSDIDKKYYLVRNLIDKQNAADMLANVRQNIFKLIEYLNEHKNNLEYIEYKNYIEQLNERIINTIIIESESNNGYTSYSINKGEKLVFCLRSKEKENIHDINLIMYVVLHEMSHIACPEIGHTQLFKKIFAFLTTIAIKLNIYKKIPFETESKEYCGMNITESII